MIRVEFTNVERGPWATEMTTNMHIATVLREHGVPLAARLAFAGVERGMLEMTHNAENATLFCVYYADQADDDPTAQWTRTHTGRGYEVFMSGEHLTAHQQQEDDEL